MRRGRCRWIARAGRIRAGVGLHAGKRVAARCASAGLARGRARWRSGRAETGGCERGHSRPQGASTVPRQAGSQALRSRGPVEALGGARHRRNPRPRPRRQPRRFDAALREEGEASPFSRAQCLGMRDCCRLPSRARENNNLLAGAIIRSEHPDRSRPRWRHLLIWASCASSPAQPCCQSGKQTMYAGIQVSHNFFFRKA